MCCVDVQLYRPTQRVTELIVLPSDKSFGASHWPPIIGSETPLLIDILLVLHLLGRLAIRCTSWTGMRSVAGVHRNRNEMREHGTVALPGMQLDGGII